ncbi:MAG: alpha/beta hydrolase [Chamaesiphon sp.]|nr:alpha/beta hydrolase [Chamaesiphon sp.]
MVDRTSRIKLSAGKIFWREAGDDRLPVVIFLHGSWYDSTQWENSIGILSKNFHCLAIDLLGFGNSTAIQTPNSIEMEVDCLHEFLTALKLHPVFLVGHSLGAWIAVSYTLKYPDLVRGVVAISPEGFSWADWNQYNQLTKWLLTYPCLLSLWLNGLKVIVSVSDGAYSLASQAYWNYFNKFPTTCSLIFQRSSKEIRRELVAERLSQFRSPLLFLQSDSDLGSIVKQSQLYAQAVRNSEYKSIKDIDSTSSQKISIQIARKILEFLDRIQTRVEREEIELW